MQYFLCPAISRCLCLRSERTNARLLHGTRPNDDHIHDDQHYYDEPSRCSWLMQTCSCQCCQSGLNCVPNFEVGIASSAQCSSSACTEACQNRYSSACPSLPYLGQTNGTCTSGGGGSARCRCRCCDTNICRDYEPNFNGNCASCQTRCQQTRALYQPDHSDTDLHFESIERSPSKPATLYTVFLFTMSLLLFR